MKTIIFTPLLHIHSRSTQCFSECARLGCNALVRLTLAEYEHVRSDPRRFVMIDGHELPAVETVVETLRGCVIVEKRDKAGERAEASDPRS